MMNRRVVVTGLGLISPLGNDLASSWAAALEGKSGIARITGFDASEFGCQIAGEVKGFDAGKYLDVKEVRRFDKFVHFGVGAGLMALEDSGLEVTEENAPMIGVAIGAGIGGLPSICANNDAMVSRGPRRISPFMIPGCIINMTSGQLAIMKGLKGPNIAHVTACSTGLHAIGEAAYIIARGDADVMLAGGTESTVCKLGIGGFDAMHALSRRNDAPEAASRPFDKDR
ncbi:MAG: beta-ketoacyl synthase N-terminal-like domain-containing protein, partial [Sutterella wadsworthensis]|nr:beta-ketoacyl synthase N-terminal-like domain-containing protein [Sutterella wadsworthensis]